MKKLLGFGILGLCFSFPAHAQHSMSGGVGPTTSGGASGGSAGNVTFHTLPLIPRTQFQAIDVSGSIGDFTPSSWTQFNEGLAEGRAELAARRKTVAEAAAETRVSEKPKAKIVITQDAVGNAIIERR